MLSALHQPAPPAVRRAIREGPEDRPAHRRLLRPRDERQRRIELIGTAMSEVLRRIAESRRLTPAPAMGPQSPNRNVLTPDLDDDLDLGISHRPGR